ncbi:hypothetical protein IU405_12835 [Polaribacter sp. BAL334]|uniref:hypothetical protein n=1 Tax=Polaribacter sp. BAL334 TaxID=1708178 RepID=UPI0018D1FADE|nr:hypothetical protein [Polaribacter sp. BAL334]MBG7613136.1 hypothetical protein [Polaribacter sp. BAL334]
MKSEIKEKIKILNLAENAPLPSPIAPKVCDCGCGNVFQPQRRDQIYLNKQHADFGYNHKTRKVKHQNRKEVEKILRTNDIILEKYYQTQKLENCATCYLDALKADGFNFAYIIGKKEKGGNENFYLYNYYYYTYVTNNIKMIKIYKR